MNRSARPLMLVLLACLLAACGAVPDTLMENGAIKLYGDVVALDVDGAPGAKIAADGGFTIDGKAVATTSTERELLARYNRSVRDVRETGLAMGKAGIGMAAKSIVAEATSSPGQADKAAEAASGRMSRLNLDLCRHTAAIKAAQDRLAMQLAAFKPYASIVGASETARCENGARD